MIWPSGAWPHGRDAGNADVVVVGDSLTFGSSASDPRGLGMVGRVKAGLRSRYGDGGDGFCPYGWGQVDGAASSAYSVGPNGHCVLISGATRWTLDVDGTTVAVHLRRTATDGTARWRIDGGDWVAVSCTGTTGYLRATAIGLERGPHIIEVEAQSGTVGIFGAEGEYPTGVRVHTMGLGLRTSAHVFASSFTDPSIAAYTPHLLVVALGLNDSNNGVITAAEFHDNIEALVLAARAARSDCDIVLIAHHLGLFTDSDYDDMRAALVEIVDVHGGLVVDLDEWARTLPDGTSTDRTDTDPTGTSWGRWSQWGWFASATEGVHPGDTGHLALAHVLGLVLAADETVPVVPDEEIEFGGVG